LTTSKSDHGRRPALSELIAKVNKLPRFVTPEGGACVNLTAVQLILAALPASSEGAHRVKCTCDSGLGDDPHKRHCALFLQAEGAHGWQDYVQHKQFCAALINSDSRIGKAALGMRGLTTPTCTCGLAALLTPSTPEDQ
jgi:hypothetical protein